MQLENDITHLQKKICDTQNHIKKTQVCCDNIGRWKTNVINIDVSVLNSIDFEIEVKLLDDECNSLTDETNKGWKITRNLKQLQNLHEKLVEISSNLSAKYKKLPSIKINRNLLAKAHDENKIEQIQTILNDYLQVIFFYFIVVVN